MVEELQKETPPSNAEDSAQSQGRKEKRGRSTELTQDEIIMLLHELMACESHVTPYGAKAIYFESVADTLDSNIDFVLHVYGKGIRYRYMRLQKLFNSNYEKNAMMTGVFG